MIFAAPKPCDKVFRVMATDLCILSPHAEAIREELVNHGR